VDIPSPAAHNDAPPPGAEIVANSNGAPSTMPPNPHPHPHLRLRQGEPIPVRPFHSSAYFSLPRDVTLFWRDRWMPRLRTKMLNETWRYWAAERDAALFQQKVPLRYPLHLFRLGECNAEHLAGLVPLRAHSSAFFIVGARVLRLLPFPDRTAARTARGNVWLTSDLDGMGLRALGLPTMQASRLAAAAALSYKQGAGGSWAAQRMACRSSSTSSASKRSRS
jgi:hypothetical protein